MGSIGFIGLGHMGLPMAVRLLEAGHDVLGFDLNESALLEFAKAGGVVETELKSLAEKSETVIMMLQTGEQILSVCLGSSGLFKYCSSEVLMINCATIGIEAVTQFYEEARQRGLSCLDAPVSGGVAAATSGGLTFMVGGSKALFDRAFPMLSVMGRLIIHTGGETSAQAAKLCNNLILGASMLAVSEAFVLAEKLGLSSQKLYEVVSQSSGRCWSMTDYAPIPGLCEHAPSNHQYQAGFSSSMMLKDLKLTQHAAHQVGLTLSLAEHTALVYTEACKTNAALDFSAVVKLIK